MKITYTDVLVVGGGLAGLRAATGVKERGQDCILLTLVPPKRSHSAAAQGGMQASLGNAIKGEGDNEDVHFADTVKGSDWGCDQKVARIFANTSPKAIRQLSEWGVPWTRVRKGDRKVVINAERVTITEKEEAHGLINARDFGGTKKWRTCYTSDGTGHSMLFAMDNKAHKEEVEVRERMEAMAIIHENGRCYGAVARNLITGELVAYIAKATVIATGGYGRIYKVSTNAVICQGMGQAIALETGVATLGNMEAIQFHPTAIVPVGILTTEGCRGDGGLLTDEDGYRFMPDYEPEKKELASRDVVSRRMVEHMRKGKGVKSRYGDHLWLDITILGRAHIEKNLREVKDICESFLGIDPAEQPIPVRPTQHYSMGGIRTDYRGESQTMKGLFSCGEAACWDMHGFNRLGGNSVAETVVSGMLVAEYVADWCDDSASAIDISTDLVKSFMKKQQDLLEELIRPKTNGEDAFKLRARMEDIMMDNVGIFRNGEDLQKAVDELEELLVRSRNIEVKCSTLTANPELFNAYRTQRMLKLALCTAKGALERKESRGAHSREDYPERNDAEYLNRTITSWPDENQTVPTVTYEEIDISEMELPPGFRGYGKDMTIVNPESEKRQDEVDKIREKLEAEGKDRFEIQEALMPYRSMMPKRYQGKNERIYEKFEKEEGSAV